MMLDPTRHVVIEFSYEPKYTWAEKKKDELIYKLKKHQANWNRFIVTVIMIAGVLMVLTGALWLCATVRSPLMPIASGYTGFQLIRLQYAFLTEAFICIPSHISIVKHKGKEYY